MEQNNIIKRGGTYSGEFVLPVPVEQISNARVVFKQSEYLLKKPLKDCQVQGNVLTVRLSQEETFQFKGDAFCTIQLVARIGDEVYPSDIFQIFVRDCLDDEVLS